MAIVIRNQLWHKEEKFIWIHGSRRVHNGGVDIGVGSKRRNLRDHRKISIRGRIAKAYREQLHIIESWHFMFDPSHRWPWKHTILSFCDLFTMLKTKITFVLLQKDYKLFLFIRFFKHKFIDQFWYWSFQIFIVQTVACWLNASNLLLNKVLLKHNPAIWLFQFHAVYSCFCIIEHKYTVDTGAVLCLKDSFSGPLKKTLVDCCNRISGWINMHMHSW